MNLKLAIAVLTVLPLLSGQQVLDAQEPLPVAAVDFYGRFTIPDSVVRHAVGIAPGDPVPDAAGAAAAVARVESLPGVVAARVAQVCCEGGTLLYVGIESDEAPVLRFREAPAGSARLPDEIIAAGGAFDRAFRAAFEAGDFAEDQSLGHALMHFPEGRRAQQAFVPLADRYKDTLRVVLRKSADATSRARAAQVLAYATDKRRVVDDLVHAMSDPDETVRNNAMRALALIAGLTERRPELGIVVPHEPFVGLLRSPVWTDRNKASFALMQLTATRDTALLGMLARDAMPELIQMARWHARGHALAALLILGRIAVMPDDDVYAAADRGDREGVIARAHSSLRPR